MVACQSANLKPKVEHPFYGWCEQDHCSHSYCVPAGMVGCVTLFDIVNPDIMGVGIEHAMKVGGRIIRSDCKIFCLKTKKIWRPHKEVVCCFSFNGVKHRKVKPWLLSPMGSCTIELPPGNYRFSAFDQDYNPIVPGECDILMKLLIKPQGGC